MAELKVLYQFCHLSVQYFKEAEWLMYEGVSERAQKCELLQRSTCRTLV